MIESVETQAVDPKNLKTESVASIISIILAWISFVSLIVVLVSSFIANAPSQWIAEDLILYGLITEIISGVTSLVLQRFLSKDQKSKSARILAIIGIIGFVLYCSYVLIWFLLVLAKIFNPHDLP